MTLRDARGFTLVELMIVIAISGILMAIAVPAFLGQMDKAKVNATVSGAKSAIADLQDYLDAYAAGGPYVIITDSSGGQGCFEADRSIGTNKACLAAFNQTSVGTYATFPGGLTTVISHFISHHTFKGDKSAFNGLPLFITTNTVVGWGQVLLSQSGNTSIVIDAYATNSTLPIFTQTVTIR
uniref:Prokaryotic N-terminal methylation motif domain protein n=1 Tax=uncultured Nitrospirae bacterium MY3-11A TaxID=798579 RepID=D9MP51_9BACT|nr:prokaryotic N-terminal methylation motif domain protein [uncultured Nitrospirae bacterium MY3-11A]